MRAYEWATACRCFAKREVEDANARNALQCLLAALAGAYSFHCHCQHTGIDFVEGNVLLRFNS